MVQIDLFTSQMKSSDIELLKECKDELNDKINHNESALVLILALGGDYDRSEDEMKSQTLDCLIKLIKIRNEYKENLKIKQESLKKNQEILRMMGL